MRSLRWQQVTGVGDKQPTQDKKKFHVQVYLLLLVTPQTQRI